VTLLLVLIVVAFVVVLVFGAALCHMSTLCERDAERQWDERDHDAD
jgi:uncharacterized membrane protein